MPYTPFSYKNQGTHTHHGLRSNADNDCSSHIHNRLTRARRASSNRQTLDSVDTGQQAPFGILPQHCACAPRYQYDAPPQQTDPDLPPLHPQCVTPRSGSRRHMVLSIAVDNTFLASSIKVRQKEEILRPGLFRLHIQACIVGVGSTHCGRQRAD